MKNALKKSSFLLVLFCTIFFVFGKESKAAGSVDVTLNGGWAVQQITSEEEVWFRLVIPSDGKVELTLQAFRDSTYYYLYNEEKTESIFREQINKGTASLPGTKTQTRYLSKGVYYLLAADNVYGSGFGGAGAVQVKAAFTSGNTNEIEPNESFDQAMPLSQNVNIRGIFTEKADRKDFFRIEVPQKGDVTLKLISMMGSVNVELYTDGKEKISSDYIHEGSEGSPATKEWKKELEAGSYYVGIQDGYYGHTACGLYMFSWSWEPPFVPVSSINLDSASKTLIEGNTGKVTAFVQPVNATKQEVKFASSDSGIVSVDANGNIKALRPGNAVITAQADDGKVSASVNVTVKGKPVVKAQSISLNQTSRTIYKGQSFKVTATVSPSDTANKAVSWSSSRPSVASVSKTGTVKALKAGTTTIKATAQDGSNISKSIRVTVKNKTVKVNISKVSLYKGKSYTLKVTTDPVVKATFKSSNPRIAVISAKGKITGKRAGSCKIYVTANGVKKTVAVTVKNQRLTVSKSSVTLRARKSYTLKATTAPYGRIAYKSSNTKIAVVSSKGKITARRRGTCKITVSANGLRKTVYVTVK